MTAVTNSYVPDNAHVHAIAAALQKRWGPCEQYECEYDNGECRIPMIREVLAEAAAQQPPPLVVDRDVVDVAWHVLCAYADLPPADLSGPERRMLVSRTHLQSTITRITPMIATRRADGT
jgi:hypothetical protein